jgi:hypothetical protein
MKFLKKALTTNLLIVSTLLAGAIVSNSDSLARIILEDELSVSETQSSESILLKGNSTVNLIVGDDYIDAGVTVTDNIDIDSIIKTGTVDTFTPGTYIITYTAIDKDGNRAETRRTVIVNSLETILPHDTNLYFAPKNEKGYLYFADPEPSENGKNRVIRVNYEKMRFNENDDSIELTEDAYLLDDETYSNPHSIDRAGKTNKFYVRTQNSYSFDVVAVMNGKLQYVKTVPLFVNIDGEEIKYSPRAFGAYNAKYDIQLLSGKNASQYTMIGIVDVKTDEVIKHIYKSIKGDGSTTSGHAKWLDADHFAVIDRGNHSLNIYKIFINEEGKIDAKNTGSIDTDTPVHAISRVKNPKSKLDLNTFFIMGESADRNGTKIPPFVRKLVFNPQTGKFNAVQSYASKVLCNTTTSCGSTTLCNTASLCGSTTSCSTKTSCATPTSCSTRELNSSDIALFSDTDYDKLKEKKISATTHHINSTPDGQYLVVPVYDGKIYKVDRVNMSIVDSVDTGVEKGLGAAHIEFSNSLNLAVVTNHWSPYITILDVSNNAFKIKGYVKIYRDGSHDEYNPEEKHLMQPHFAQISEDGKYFYTFASQDNGRFVRVNLEELVTLEVDDENVFLFENNDDDTEVMKSIDVEGAPEQAHS